MTDFYMKKKDATLQDIFNMISDAECEVFCLASDNPKNEKLQECERHMRAALKAYHEATGCKNES